MRIIKITLLLVVAISLNTVSKSSNKVENIIKPKNGFPSGSNYSRSGGPAQDNKRISAERKKIPTEPMLISQPENRNINQRKQNHEKPDQSTQDARHRT